MLTDNGYDDLEFMHALLPQDFEECGISGQDSIRIVNALEALRFGELPTTPYCTDQVEIPALRKFSHMIHDDGETDDDGGAFNGFDDPYNAPKEKIQNPSVAQKTTKTEEEEDIYDAWKLTRRDVSLLPSVTVPIVTAPRDAVVPMAAIAALELERAASLKLAEADALQRAAEELEEELYVANWKQKEAVKKKLAAERAAATDALKIKAASEARAVQASAIRAAEDLKMADAAAARAAEQAKTEAQQQRHNSVCVQQQENDAIRLAYDSQLRQDAAAAMLLAASLEAERQLQLIAAATARKLADEASLRADRELAQLQREREQVDKMTAAAKARKEVEQKLLDERRDQEEKSFLAEQKARREAEDAAMKLRLIEEGVNAARKTSDQLAAEQTAAIDEDELYVANWKKKEALKKKMAAERAAAAAIPTPSPKPSQSSVMSVLPEQASARPHTITATNSIPTAANSIPNATNLNPTPNTSGSVNVIAAPLVSAKPSKLFPFITFL